MPSASDWNDLVPSTNRFDSPNRNIGGMAAGGPTHVVIHVTGTTNLGSVQNTFMNSSQQRSAHYVIAANGTLFQFARDADRAWHAGIGAPVRSLYARGPSVWRRHLRYFDWYRGYPADAVYVDANLQPTSQDSAVFVARADDRVWPHYGYFSTRWPGQSLPVNYAANPDPNRYAIGIETMGVGGSTNDPNVYPPAMYQTLDRLLADLSAKYGIPRHKGRVVGHEDVNPVERFGWDPNAGFDWSAVYRP